MATIRKRGCKFIAGHNGYHGGRPKDKFKVAELARPYTVEAVETLIDARTIECVEWLHRRF